MGVPLENYMPLGNVGEPNNAPGTYYQIKSHIIILVLVN
jgi:hypothetical protein